jgi:hypothetical protein
MHILDRTCHGPQIYNSYNFEIVGEYMQKLQLPHPWWVICAPPAHPVIIVIIYNQGQKAQSFYFYFLFKYGKKKKGKMRKLQRSILGRNERWNSGNASEHKVGSGQSSYKVCIKISTSRYLKSTPNIYGM